jgi:tRNA-Thr(GGU) m(6)t(6)A37 methyltransferase TsaA
VFEEGWMVCAGKAVFTPIGCVKTNAVGEQLKDKSTVSKIEVNANLVDGLSGIREFSHLFVLYHLDQVTDEQRKTLKVYPRGRTDLPLTGVFATRTMMRPNPIALTLVELLKVEDTILTVKGLEAYDGTPVLDIKPYDPWDKVENPKVPDWWKKLEHEKPPR